MKELLWILATLLVRGRAPGIEEQYLAQALDAQDLRRRLLILEQAPPWDTRPPAPGRWACFRRPTSGERGGRTLC